MPDLIPVPFHSDTLYLIDHQGRPWLTAEQAGVALGFKHPAKAINNIFQRHTDEFGPEDSCDLKLRVQGDSQTRPTPIFLRPQAG